MAEQDFDKSEQPTPYKLQEARKKGQVAKSMEVNSLFILAVAYCLFVTLGWDLVKGLAGLSSFLFSQSANIILSEANYIFLLQQLVAKIRELMWPYLSAMVVVSIGATLIQTGFIWTFFPLKPDVQRLNPVAGFKRLFSMRLLYESAKTFIKLLMFSAVLMTLFHQLLPYSAQAFDMSAVQVLHHLQFWAGKLIFSLLAVLLAVALIDVVYSRRDFTKRMRMSKREVKDEHKKREGDPLLKQKRKQVQKSINAQLVSAGNTTNADVVITNPTHLAVALQYDRATMATPIVVAKGSGDQAQKIKTLARKQGIAILENKPLARALFRHVSVSRPITAELFPQVAQIYIWLYKTKGSQ